MRCCVFAFVGLLVCTSVLFADDTPDATFQTLYGAKLQQVQKTRETADDLALAKELLSQSADVASEPELQGLMFAHAVDLSLADPGGEPTTTNAILALRQLEANAQRKANDKLLGLLDKRYAALTGSRRKPVAVVLLGVLSAQADAESSAGQVDKAVALSQRAVKVAQVVSPSEIDRAQERLKMLTARQSADARAQSLAKTAHNDPKAAAELVQLLLVDLDRPREAAQYATLVADPQLSEIALIAGRSGDEVKDADTLKLANWYRTRSEKAADPRPLLLRSRELYSRFLAGHAVEDLQRLEARVGLESTASALGKIAITNKDRASCDAQLKVEGENVHGVDKLFNEPATFEKRGSIYVVTQLLKHRDVIVLHPQSEQTPTTLDFSAVTTQGAGTLVVEYHSAPGCDCVIVVKVDGKEVKRAPVAGEAWKSDRFAFHGSHIVIENWASGWFNEHLALTYHIE